MTNMIGPGQLVDLAAAMMCRLRETLRAATSALGERCAPAAMITQRGDDQVAARLLRGTLPCTFAWRRPASSTYPCANAFNGCVPDFAQVRRSETRA